MSSYTPRGGFRGGGGGGFRGGGGGGGYRGGGGGGGYRDRDQAPQSIEREGH